MQVEKNKEEDETRARIQEVIGNIRLVKTYNTQAGEYEFVSNKYGIITKLSDKQSNFYHIMNFIRQFGLEIVLVIILYRAALYDLQSTFGVEDSGRVVQERRKLRSRFLGRDRRP